MASPTVLIGYDASADARQAIATAGGLIPHATAVVVSVWEPIGEGGAGLVALPADVVRTAIRDLDATAQRLARERAEEGAELARQAGFAAARARPVRAEGNVWASLAATADDEDAAVIAVGRRGRSRVASLLLGSVSNGIVQHARRPVLLVPPLESRAA